jgi:uncharacterized protein
MNPSIQLASGRYFDYTNFGSKDIDILDIASSLSKLCRYTGHCDEFYSVAQHSVYVSNIVDPRFALEGLLHDASEAYLGDVNRPLKLLLPEYRALEAAVDRAVRTRYNLPAVETPEVKEADNILLVTESRDLMPKCPDDVPDEWAWAHNIPRLDREIMPLPPVMAKALFIQRFTQLTGVYL